jgi:transcription termination/antitermination protein NusG
MSRQQNTYGRAWYVVHTYSGYEDAVARNLRQRIESLGYQDKIFNVLVPHEKTIKVKGAKKQTIDEKVYPGYVLVEMIVDDDSWYLVRNTPRVTGFVGSGTQPVPISLDELNRIMQRAENTAVSFQSDFQTGDKVIVLEGPFKDQYGVISEITPETGRARVVISIFGRETPVDLDFTHIKAL